MWQCTPPTRLQCISIQVIDPIANHQTVSNLEASLASNPHDRATLINLGKCYATMGRITDAIHLLRTAAELYPNIFWAQSCLGDAYCLAMQPDDAIRHYHHALALRPEDSNILINLSVCHWLVGDFDTAYRYGRLARKEHPHNFGILSLLIGDYEEGWKHWELGTARSVDGLPSWEGEDIQNKHVLVLDENQGFGDTIMMARFLPLLISRCGAVTFQTREPLIRLMQHSFPNIGVMTEIDDLTAFDVQVRLFDLPRLFSAKPHTLPKPPYLTAAEDDCSRWRTVLAKHDGIKVGLRWSGSPSHPNDHLRTISDLSVMAPLQDVPGVTYVSLAKEAYPTPDLPMLNVIDQLADFAETAALIATLDLIISVDTSVSNLAGALGAETWLLNRLGTDWRWGVTDDPSPWYPSVRIFRQPAIGDWTSVIARIRAALLARTSV